MLHRRSYRTPFYFLFFAFFFVSLFYVVLDYSISGPFWAIAEHKAHILATKAINQTINEKIIADVNYQEFLYVKSDQKGRIVMMQSNSIKMAQIVANTTLEVQSALENIKEEEIAIPLGEVLGGNLLANRGPFLKVGILPVGNVDIKIRDSFESSGINQTRFKVYLDVHAKIKIVAPLLDKSINVVSTIPLAETILLGDVPGTYLKFN